MPATGDESGSDRAAAAGRSTCITVTATWEGLLPIQQSKLQAFDEQAGRCGGPARRSNRLQHTSFNDAALEHLGVNVVSFEAEVLSTAMKLKQHPLPRTDGKSVFIQRRS